VRTEVLIERASDGQAAVVTGILNEAALWAQREHGRLWTDTEIDPRRIAAEVARGEFFLARSAGDFAATMRYQHIDAEFWPEADPTEAAYVHRLAVRRRYAGRGLAATLLQWAADRARSEGRRYLRLDADLTRPKLLRLYESCGFEPHSERQVGPYRVMRYEKSLAGLPSS
jgi:GNAT superfamily N-acetyltransferase